MNMLSCGTLHSWCDDLGKHATGTAGCVMTLLTHSLFSKEVLASGSAASAKLAHKIPTSLSFASIPFAYAIQNVSSR